MKTKIKSRLPGVYFQVEPPPLEEVLPRMDIAAFVGLAASGPLDTPVPVEDVASFRDIFGDDFPLAWDAATDQMQYAHLASAVEAFFRNGGRRCWVVRVAGRKCPTDAKGAKANRFSLPGLISADNWRPALARARSEGSWSDILRVGTVRLSQALGQVYFQFKQNPMVYNVDLTITHSQVRHGDLLQLNFGEEGPLLFLVVDSVETVPSAQGGGGILSFQRLKGTQGYWFLRRYESSPPLIATGAVLLTPEGEKALPLLQVRLPDEESYLYEIDLDLSLEKAPTPGNLLRIDFMSGQSLLLPIMATGVASDVSPPGEAVRISGEAGLWPLKEEEGVELAMSWQMGSPPEERQISAERLLFEIWVWRGQEARARIGELAFSDKHPRFWGKLPVDAELFCLPERRPLGTARGPLEAEASEPRFPLAGHKEAAMLYLPLGMPIVPDQTAAQGPLDGEGPDTALQRDGLENFSSDLFLDPDLACIGSRALLTEAEQKYYLQRKPLRGLHSLLPLEEVTLVAVPDAVQLGWERTQVRSEDLLSAPILEPIPKTDDQGVYTLSWSRVAGATAYTLQKATDTAFAHAATLLDEASFKITEQSLENLKAEGTPNSVLEKLEGIKDQIVGKEMFLDILETIIGDGQTVKFKSLILQYALETTACISDGGGCPRLYYYRVHAVRGSEVSPWSNTESAVVPLPDFANCQAVVLAAPKLEPILVISPPGNEYVLHWNSADGATGYTLQEAADPAFNTARTIYTGSEAVFRVRLRSEGVYYYRVRARRDVVSPWSNVEGANVKRALLSLSNFEDRQTVVLTAPELKLVSTCSPAEDSYSLSWSSVANATGYTLQEAVDLDFDTATTIYSGGGMTFHIKRQNDGGYYYRVRAQSNEVSPWSNTQVVVLAPRLGWTINKPEDYKEGDLLAVQRALLRFSAARGDLLAVLSLPSHYREDEALAHVAVLTPRTGGDMQGFTGSGKVRVPPLTLGEDRVLSFGALYHPWIATRIEAGRDATVVRFVPPNGAVCGMIAVTAIARGAWIAPANDPIRGVVSLDPDIDRQGWGRLFEAQVNLIRQDPREFLLLSADTLSLESELRPINVRRLLILLRRIALREGTTLVFEPNNESFRSLVQRTFERILSDIYVRGAFAGETPEKAYQVITDSSVNTQSSLDQGRFITELRVAPSQPMVFITVRLVQTGSSGLVVTEG